MNIHTDASVLWSTHTHTHTHTHTSLLCVGMACQQDEKLRTAPWKCKSGNMSDPVCNYVCVCVCVCVSPRSELRVTHSLDSEVDTDIDARSDVTDMDIGNGL